jgi:hypothetical protein
MVNAAAPAAAVPENVPDWLRASHVGWPVADHEYGGKPPDAVPAALNVKPAVSVGNGHGVVIDGVPPGASMRSVSDAAADEICKLSVIVAVMATVEADGGVPEITPDAGFKLAHTGRFCADQTSAPVPPVAASWAA